MTLTLSLVFWGTVFISPFPDFAQLIVPYQTRRCIADVESEQKQRIAKRGKLTEYLETLRNQGLISSFNEALWYGTVEQVRVTTEGNLRFIFRDGQEITV